MYLKTTIWKLKIENTQFIFYVVNLSSKRSFLKAVEQPQKFALKDRECRRYITTWLSVSSSSASSGFLTFLLSRWSQYLASSSGDLLLASPRLVTELLLMNFPQALSREATNPLSLVNAVNTRLLYFRWTSRIVLTYNLGSCKIQMCIRVLEIWRKVLAGLKNVVFEIFLKITACNNKCL